MNDYQSYKARAVRPVVSVTGADIVELPVTARRGLNEIQRPKLLVRRSTASSTPRSPATPSTTSRSRRPPSPGVEALGVVEFVGEGVERSSKVGDAVATVRFGGGYREANTAAARRTSPRCLGPEREWLRIGLHRRLGAARLGRWRGEGGGHGGDLRRGGRARPLLVQLAKLRGCKVIAVCGGPKKCAFIKSLGADRVIDYRAENVGEVLAAEFKDQLNVAVDTVSGDIFDAFVENLAVHGRLVAAGAAQDLEGRLEIVTAPRIVHKLYYKGASIRGFMNGLLTERWADARRTLFDLYRAGRLRVSFDEQPFEGLPQVYDAVEHLLSGRSMGKVIVNLAADAQP